MLSRRENKAVVYSPSACQNSGKLTWAQLDMTGEAVYTDRDLGIRTHSRNTESHSVGGWGKGDEKESRVNSECH